MKYTEKMKYTEEMARATMLAAMKAKQPGILNFEERFAPMAWAALLRLAVQQEQSGDYGIIYFWGLLPLLTHLVTFNVDHWDLTWA